MKSRQQAKSKQQVVSEFRRAAILDAARTVFARSGFTGAIMDAIAREAGIAKGTVYLYFRSKTEIYKAVLDYDMHALQASCLAHIHAAPTLPAKIEAFALARLENADARREFFRIMDAEGANLMYNRRQYREWHREPVLRLAQAIERAAGRGEIRPLPPEKTAWLIADMIRGAVQRRILEQDNSPAPAEARALRDFIWPALSVDNNCAVLRSD